MSPKKKTQLENEKYATHCNNLFVSTNANSSQGESQLCVFEDNEAVIQMIIKGRSPTMRLLSRAH